MPTIEAEFEVYCSCGEGLCNQTTTRANPGNRGYSAIEVEPCEKCIENARSEGHQEGYEEGHKWGVQEGMGKGGE